MSTTKGTVTRASIQGIADGIRYANGSNTQYKPDDMESAVRALKKTLVQKTITQNGTYDPASDSADGYSSVAVSVESGGDGNIETFAVNWNDTVLDVNNTHGVIISDGHFATLTLRVTGKNSANIPAGIIGTIPEELKPSEGYGFQGGNGGTSGYYRGYIDKDGNIRLSNAVRYLFATVTWAIAENTIPIVYDTNIFTNVSGGVAVSGKFAQLRCLCTTNSFSAGWKNACITIPAEVRPTDDIAICCNYNSGYYDGLFADTVYNIENGTTNIYIDRNRGTSLLLSASWKIPQTQQNN